MSFEKIIHVLLCIACMACSENFHKSENLPILKVQSVIKKQIRFNRPAVKALNIIPQPQKITLKNDFFRIKQGIQCLCNDQEAVPSIKLFYQNFNNQVDTCSRFFFFRDTTVANEGYKLHITRDSVIVRAHGTGYFYAIQTLLQMVQDPQFYEPRDSAVYLPCLHIDDHPEYAYRSLHFDVSRHYFPIPFIKKLLSLMAYYKLNNFHWHLTDGAGWRIEIKQYPELVEKAAWRTHESWNEWRKRGNRGYSSAQDTSAYGGFYTQEEARDIVKYAKKLNINVIPEIEMPGHNEEVIYTFPQLGCTGKARWNCELCPGKEETFTFIENVLDEITDIFPSKFIHCGGDEVSYATWSKCNHCKARMEAEGFSSVKSLHTYFMRRVQQILAKRNRSIIGWDDIIAHGSMDSSTVVMAWHGLDMGIATAKKGYDVIISPMSHCYLDYYQSDPTTQPKAFGGFINYIELYTLNPRNQLDSLISSHILGVQANMWTEYVPTNEHAEYMIFPRALALAEVAWTSPANKNRVDFIRRTSKHLNLLKRNKVNAYQPRDLIIITSETDTVNRHIQVKFTPEQYGADIHYTINGESPTLDDPPYRAPFTISDSANIQAAVFFDDSTHGKVHVVQLDYHKAIGCPVKYVNGYSNSYPAAGTSSLTDGMYGGNSYRDGKWQGFLGHMNVIVDLGEKTTLTKCSARFINEDKYGVHFPTFIQVSVSNDMKHFTPTAYVSNDSSPKNNGISFQRLVANFNAQARYVRIVANNPGGFIFTDEIVLY